MRVHTLAPADDTSYPIGLLTRLKYGNIHEVPGRMLPECVINMLFLVLWLRFSSLTCSAHVVRARFVQCRAWHRLGT